MCLRKLSRDYVFKPDSRQMSDTHTDFALDKKYERMMRQLEETGHTGDKGFSDLVREFRRNPDMLMFWDGDISFEEACKRVGAKMKR